MTGVFVTFGTRCVGYASSADPDIEMQRGGKTVMTDINGNKCRGSLCPNDPRTREYVRQLYRIVASDILSARAAPA